MVGYNNAGKSNVLNALEWLISNGSLVEDDFFDKEQPVEVVAKITGVSEGVLSRLEGGHRKKIEKYVYEESITIMRKQDEPGAKASTNKLWFYKSDERGWDFNPTGIDAAIKKLFPDTIRINAMEDAASDASKAKSTSTIGKLLKEVSESVVLRYQHEVDETLGAVRNSLSAEGDTRFDGLTAIDGKINESIGAFFPRVSGKLDIPVPDLEELFGSGTLKIYEDGAEEGRPIQYYGHGSQRSVQMALVKLLADIKGDRNQDCSTKLLLIDEPELYLHPFAIDVLMEAFQKLSSDGYQIIYSTHSSQLINKDNYGSTILVRKSKEEGSFIRKPLSVVVRDVVDKPEHCQDLIYSLSHASQIFFSEKVVVTEGKTEKKILPALYSAVNGSSMPVNHIGLTSLNGKDIYPKAHKIFKLMDLPVKFVADLDFAFKLASNDEFIASDDPDYLSLLAHLKELEDNGEILLDERGLPKSKKAPCPAEEAYRKLAEKDGAVPHVIGLHEKLLSYDIWVWPKGSIEDHVGNESKSELGLLKYVRSLQQQGVAETCPDPEAVARFVSWIDS